MPRAQDGVGDFGEYRGVWGTPWIFWGAKPQGSPMPLHVLVSFPSTGSCPLPQGVLGDRQNYGGFRGADSLRALPRDPQCLPATSSCHFPGWVLGTARRVWPGVQSTNGVRSWGTRPEPVREGPGVTAACPAHPASPRRPRTRGQWRARAQRRPSRASRDLCPPLPRSGLHLPAAPRGGLGSQ